MRKCGWSYVKMRLVLCEIATGPILKCDWSYTQCETRIENCFFYVVGIKPRRYHVKPEDVT